MEWIRLEDQLPPRDGSPFLGYSPEADELSKIYVLVYVASKIYKGEFSRLSHDSFYREAGGECYFTFIPTHWMPLPVPPKDN